jgi:hypothetical protein
LRSSLFVKGLRFAGLSRPGYTGLDKTWVFDQTFFEKVCVSPVDHASVTPF